MRHNFTKAKKDIPLSPEKIEEIPDNKHILKRSFHIKGKINVAFT